MVRKKIQEFIFLGKSWVSSTKLTLCWAEAKNINMPWIFSGFAEKSIFFVFKNYLHNLCINLIFKPKYHELINWLQFSFLQDTFSGSPQKHWIFSIFPDHQACREWQAIASMPHHAPKIILGVLLSHTLDIKIACLVLIFKLQHQINI